MSTLEYLDSLTPADIGLGSVFPSFRPIQLEAMELAVYSDARFIGLGAPTGSGKTGIPLGIAALTGWRTVIVTATNGLLDQYMKTKAPGLVSVMGRRNYECTGGVGASNCEEARWKSCENRLSAKEFSSWMANYKAFNGRASPPCAHDEARMEMLNAPVVVTNYAYWLYSRQGWGNVDCLVLDEAHAAGEQVAGAMGVRVGERELRECVGLDHTNVPEEGDIGGWRVWCMDMGMVLDLNLEGQKAVMHKSERELKKYQQMGKLKEKFEALSQLDEDWIIQAKKDQRWGRSWEFDAVWPGRYAEGRLHKGIKKVVYMSATLKAKTLTDNGIKREEMEFREWRRVFQRSRCPVYYFPAKSEEGKQIRITNKTSQEHKLLWVRHLDYLISWRKEVRIVLLTTSYKYQEFIMEHSGYAQYMLGNTQDPDSDSAQEMFERFIRTPPPVVLCSPSFGTGWDFKDDRARVVIISKVPLAIPGGADRLMAARLARDPRYGDNQTMQAVAQAVGRPQRSEEDWGEVLICDASWSWFGYKNKDLAPIGLCDDVRTIDKLPLLPNGGGK